MAADGTAKLVKLCHPICGTQLGDAMAKWTNIERNGKSLDL